MDSHLEIAQRLEDTARLLRDLDTQPGPAFEASQVLPADLGALWSASPLTRSKPFRAVLINQWIQGLKAVLGGLGWQGQIIVSEAGVLVEIDGVRMRADHDFRFFRKFGHSAGASLLERLRRIRQQPRCIVDIGANIGEISLFFSRHLPEAKVLAVEASSENVAEFGRNRALQTFATDNLELLHSAVADREGDIEITVGAGDMNTILVEEGMERLRDRGTTSVERVRAVTLDTVVEAAGGGPIDLMKIDIEGAEPLLGDALVRHAGLIRTIFVEFSVFNTLAAYVDLNDKLLDAGYSVFDSKMRSIAAPAAWLADARESSTSVNLWYIHRDAGENTG